MQAYLSYYNSPLGPMTMASDGESLTGLWFDGQKYFGAGLPERQENGRLAVFKQTEAWLDLYFSGERPDFFPALALRGTEFRKQVWQILLSIPYGSLMTYGEIAEQLAVQMHRQRMSAQAVGGAVGHNPVSLIVPCHRVVGADGSLTGYAGGTDKKLELLRLEHVNTEGLYLPGEKRRGNSRT